MFETKEGALGAVAEFGYKLDLKGLELTPIRFDIQPDRFFVAIKELDFSLITVSPRSRDSGTALTDIGYHRLVGETGKLAKASPSPSSSIRRAAAGRSPFARTSCGRNPSRRTTSCGIEVTRQGDPPGRPVSTIPSRW